LYSTIFVTLIKSRKVKAMGVCNTHKETKDIKNVFKCHDKRLFDWPWRRWEGTIKMDHIQMCWEVLNWNWLR